MYLFLLIIHVILAVLLVTFILLQQGRGAQTGAAFGSGASTTIFGSQGAGSFLSRTTWILVGLFFVVNLSLANLTNRYSASRTAIPAEVNVPATEVPVGNNQHTDIPSE